MAYLRSAPSTPECPAMLPRSVQLISSPSIRLEALLEIRDEASYLDLEELYQLCNAEIRHRESVTTQTRVGSGVSVHSVHTFRESPSSEHHAEEPSNETVRDSIRSAPQETGSVATRSIVVPPNEPHRDSIVTHRSAPKERGSVATRSTDQIVLPPSTSHSRSRSHGRPERTAPLRSPPIYASPPPGWI
jgi:hypothetical protein